MQIEWKYKVNNRRYLIEDKQRKILQIFIIRDRKDREISRE